mmetsp:Transcript_7604/g.13709  ORF Transcript_7604/g.13709 Transcript_7604/m.13709 type:complete len:246 (+) Transcript_7604:137-874(+)
MTRTLAVPFGTMGKQIAEAKTPSSKSLALKALARSSSPSITGIIGVSEFPISKPSSVKPFFKYSTLDQSFCTLCSDSPSMFTASTSAAVSGMVSAIENSLWRADIRYASMSGCLAAMKPPVTEKALERLPISMSTSPSRPKWLTTPRPPCPRTPSPWASSTIVSASYFLARSTISGSLARSPSIEKTPSVMIRICGCSPFFFGFFAISVACASFVSRSSMSECAYANLFCTPATFTASMIDAWFS